MDELSESALVVSKERLKRLQKALEDVRQVNGSLDIIEALLSAIEVEEANPVE